MDTTGMADGRLAEALREYAATGFSGVLRVEGRPGGTLYFADGGIAGCETPGAPGLEVVLLRSHRISEDDWEAAFAAAAVAGVPLITELVSRGLLGAGEAEALLRTSLADAVFAVLSGPVDGWFTAPAADCPLPLIPAARPGWLLGEAARRAQVLAAADGPPVRAADRFVRREAAAPPAAGDLGGLLDGRRTIRDLAFARGCGLYATMLELSRMQAAGTAAVAGSAGDPGPASRTAGLVPGGEGLEPAADGLPRRRKERPGSHRAAEPGRRLFTPGIRLLRPRSEGGTG